MIGLLRRRLKKAPGEEELAPSRPQGRLRAHMLTSRLEPEEEDFDNYNNITTKYGHGPIHVEGMQSQLAVLHQTVGEHAHGGAEAYLDDSDHHRTRHVSRIVSGFRLTPHPEGEYNLHWRGSEGLFANTMHHFPPEGERPGMTVIPGHTEGGHYGNVATNLWHGDTQAHISSFLEHHPEHADNRVVVAGVTMPYRLGQLAGAHDRLRNNPEAAVPFFYDSEGHHPQETAPEPGFHPDTDMEELRQPGHQRLVRLSPVTMAHGPLSFPRDKPPHRTVMGIAPVKGFEGLSVHGGRDQGSRLAGFLHALGSQSDDPHGLAWVHGPVPGHAFVDIGHMIRAHRDLHPADTARQFDPPEAE